MIERENARTPVNVLTGFLGAGKTTLLSRMLRSPQFADCAVLINEFGEVGLDHHLIERVDGDVVLMKSGCICCTVRGDLSRAIRDLLTKRDAGAVAPFRRLVIETTGLADPVPVLATVMHDPVLQHHLRSGNVLTVVDAVHGLKQLDSQPESRRQAALADRIVLSKTDLPEGAAQRATLCQALLALNPAAQVLESGQGEVDADALLGQDVFSADHKSAEAQRWLNAAAQRKFFPVHAGPGNVHRDIQSFVVHLPDQLDWGAFGLWLSLLVHRHGERILRIKGVLQVAGASAPVAVHAVHKLIHPPVHLGQPVPGLSGSLLVFIVQGLDAERVRASAARSLVGRNTAVPAAPQPVPVC
jgi:G3E family GTPase